tara:strand:- start:106 stop:309 length:204 start_codon:yes stop_codon:yes gene_type:complete
MKLIIQSDRELTYNELSACCTAFKLSIKDKLPRGGKKIYRDGKDFAKGCDVKVKRYKDSGDYIAEVV